MDEGETQNNKCSANLYTPVWLGCPAFPTGEPPVTGTVTGAKRAKRTFPFEPSAKPLLRSGTTEKLSVHYVSRVVPNPFLSSCRGGWPVERYVPNEPKGWPVGAFLVSIVTD